MPNNDNKDEPDSFFMIYAFVFFLSFTLLILIAGSMDGVTIEGKYPWE